MENTTTDPLPPITPTTPSPPTTQNPTKEDLNSLKKSQTCIQTLSSILPNPLPSSYSSSTNPAFSLLHDTNVAVQVATLLRKPESGAGDDNLCRWLYDTFQTSDQNLQLVVLRFVPLVTGLYMSRVAKCKTLAGLEAVLLALYGSETASRAGQAITVNIPDMSHSSLYHESKSSLPNNSVELNMAIISPSLEPYASVKSTMRAKIVGVALDLYYSKITQMPIDSKKEFCEFCEIWAGQDGEMFKEGMEQGTSATEVALQEGSQEPPPKLEVATQRQNVTIKEGRVPLPWELLQPALRILGHCLMGQCNKDDELLEAACEACRSLYARSMHDVSPRAILATESLLRLARMAKLGAADNLDDPTELPILDVISL